MVSTNCFHQSMLKMDFKQASISMEDFTSVEVKVIWCFHLISDHVDEIFTPHISDIFIQLLEVITFS